LWCIKSFRHKKKECGCCSICLRELSEAEHAGCVEVSNCTG
jgi:hypothetical protein